jgi:hypothetical protein
MDEKPRGKRMTDSAISRHAWFDLNLADFF